MGRTRNTGATDALDLVRILFQLADMAESSALAAPSLDAPSAECRTAREVARGIMRLFARNDIWCLAEMPLRNGRRADLMGVDPKGRIVIVEVKVAANGPTTWIFAIASSGACHPGSTEARWKASITARIAAGSSLRTAMMLKFCDPPRSTHSRPLGASARSSGSRAAHFGG